MSDNNHVTEHVKLIEMAVEAAEDVSQVTNEAGQRMEIERDPAAPGSLKLTSFVADGVADGRITIATDTRAAARPEFYPDDMPFLPGIQGRLSYLDGTLQMATWFGSESGMKERAQRLKGPLEEIGERVGSVPKPVKGEDPEELRARLQAFMDSLSETDRRVMSDLGDSMRGPLEAREAMDAGLDAVVAQSQSDGWTLIKDSSPLPFPPTRMVELHKGDRIRMVTRSEMFGAMQMMLIHLPKQG